MSDVHSKAPAQLCSNTPTYFLSVLQAMAVLSAWWLLAKCRTSFYLRHRIPLVLLLKSVLALGVLHITNDSPRFLYLPHKVVPSSAMLAFQTAMIGGVVHLPALCVGLALPFRMQLAWALWRASVLVLGYSCRGGWC
jgi:hypothetical protein